MALSEFIIAKGVALPSSSLTKHRAQSFIPGALGLIERRLALIIRGIHAGASHEQDSDKFSITVSNGEVKRGPSVVITRISIGSISN